jgi:hypothetical protein
MPAYTVSITCQSKHWKDNFFIRPIWWDCDELISDDRFEEVELNRGFKDLNATLSILEVIELHERYKLQSKSGTYSSPEWQERIQPEITELDDFLYKKDKDFGSLSVCISQW